ncbi:MAG TPA: 16S rRNA (guanine(527)-N(7))-methyltransferase RsmG [Bacillota bacterium]|nr:16S rRNA (guanine(527)-N(7))-methyltransferase RsmG [Bacillota bacterium]HOG52286.1 16S rRNA (guanine(527)-N(7))-methyltransferase RsmG [Bacillota bacterium]
MEGDFREILKAGSSEIGVELDDRQIAAMEEYKDALLHENEKYNLTGIKDTLGIAIKHFVDSLTLLLIEGLKECGSFIDVGTGAGFPGLVLAIMLPGAEGTLLDSVGKKVGFVNRTAAMLGLGNVKGVVGRAEDLAKDEAHRERYGLSVARGVSSVSASAEYCIPFLRKGGQFVAMKGPGVDAELEDGKAAAFALGAKITSVQRLDLPFAMGERNLVVAIKNSPTPARFPRRAGEAARRPITRK